ADRPQAHRSQGAPQAARHQGGEEVGADHRRSEEAPPLQARDRRPPGDPQVPEEHGAADPQAAVAAPGPRDRAGLQDRPPLPVPRRAGPPGGGRGVPRRAVRGHQPVRHPRQARHHHAQGHPARPPHPWGEGLSRPPRQRR
uniref:Uncharacterized protein n=1 Tax=Triticum urartu TaxID=4572 RepID=A0A8R7VBB5_TRIUA